MSTLQGAHNFVITDSVFVDGSRRGVDNGESSCPECGSWLGADNDDDEGWRLLHKAALFDALYDSAVQESLDPPLPATRHGRLVDELEDLVKGDPVLRALVFGGPRSNLAHLCAKRLDDCLCASFFVSQHLQTDDPVRFFPTIAYQLSRHSLAYSNFLARELRRDPSILRKNLKAQFKKLIIGPIRELLAEGHDFGRRKIIIIDGFEEYGRAQTRLDILRIILSGAGELPFIWLIFGRPDLTLDKRVVEMGSTAPTPWGNGYPTLQARTYSRGGVYSFVLLHSQAGLMDFEFKNIKARFLFFF